MSKNHNTIISAFGLAKEDKLVSEDSYSVRTFGDIVLGIVADGVGGSGEGEKASRRVVDYMSNNFKNRPKAWDIPKSLKLFITNINNILYQESKEQYGSAKLLTTLAIVVIYNNRLYGANVGDSRIYLKRDGSLKQLSFDHNDSEKDHLITQAVGGDVDINPYFFENDLKSGDKILLCSDGLYTVFDEDTLSKNLSLSATSLVKEASRVVDDNLSDDTSAVVIEIRELNPVALLKKKNLPIPKTLNEGDKIDSFILEKPLAPSKRTWIAKDGDKKVVIKFPDLKAIDDEWMLDIFIKELWNATRLKAGFSPKAWIPENRTSRYYVMEYIEGGDLHEYVERNRKVTVDDAISLARFMLKASIYFAGYDLAHGDIKPENIMLTKRKDHLVFKFIDFGLITELFSTNSKAGTPSYLAPERFLGATISEKTEIFSIGVTLYFALTGELPYGDIGDQDNPEYPSPVRPKEYNNKIPDWLDHIIFRSITIYEDKRYSLYSEMLFDIDNSDQVKPFFLEDESFVKKNPLKFYQIGFLLMLILNIILIALLLT